MLPGQLAVTRAGSGTTHSERAGDAATRFVQMWLRPGSAGGDPVREVATPDLSPTGLVPVAGRDGLALDVPGATLAIADLSAGETVDAARRAARLRLRGHRRTGPVEPGRAAGRR